MENETNNITNDQIINDQIKKKKKLSASQWIAIGILIFVVLTGGVLVLLFIGIFDSDKESKIPIIPSLNIPNVNDLNISELSVQNA